MGNSPAQNTPVKNTTVVNAVAATGGSHFTLVLAQASSGGTTTGSQVIG